MSVGVSRLLAPAWADDHYVHGSEFLSVMTIVGLSSFVSSD